MKKRRLLSLLLAFVLLFALAGCSNQTESEPDANAEQPGAPSDTLAEQPEEEVTIRVAALSGPTAIGMVKLMADSEQGETQNTYEFTVAGAPDEITGKVIQGEFDIAAVPTNVASVLYNKTGGNVQLAALNTLGVLYVVENGDTVHSMADLAGQTLYATGKGSTPEYALNYVLEANGLTPGQDLQVEYKTEHAELATLLASGQATLALLPQPFVTSVLTQNPDARVALDLTEEWNKASDGQSALTMGCIVVQKEFAQQHPEALQAFLEEYKASVDYVTDAENLEEAAALTEQYGIIKAAVAQQAIPECNIVFISGEEMKTMASGFYEVLLEADPTAEGGQLPGDDFYYEG